MKLAIKTVAASAVLLGPLAAQADSIDPAVFNGPELMVGESVTIRKKVTVDAGGPTDALIDAHFLIDTSGSMGGEVNAAKVAASSLLSSLTAEFGDVSAGVGVFSEGAFLTDTRPNANVIIGGGLTTDNPTFTNNVNSVALEVPDNGFDFPESGYTAIALAGDNLSWRPGSNRFMFVFTDATGKGDTAGAQATLLENGITLVALAYRGADSSVQSTYGNILGADVFSATTSAAGIIADVTAGITAGFAEYSEVTVDDLGNGLPQFSVSTACVSADTGLCNGAVAEGDYDRSESREFEFDVTFTREAEGDADFFTFALVDGGVVARERDIFGDGGPGPEPMPAPSALALMGLGLGMFGFGATRRRRAA
jgi:hypothetical protein